MKVAVHLGQDYQDNQAVVRYFAEANLELKCTKYLRFFPLIGTLFHGRDRPIKLSKTNVYVFSDSVLRLGRINEYPRSKEAWKDKFEWFTK